MSTAWWPPDSPSVEVDGEEYKVSNSPDEVVVIGDKEEDGVTMVEEVVKDTAEAKEQLPSSVPPSRNLCVI